MSSILVIEGDCRDVMARYEPNTFDSIVTDPPYGLEFMGQGWDKGVPGVEFWEAAFRVLKPGAHILAFGGTRTYHRLACAIEDAGFEVRDCLAWVYSSGFPKSLNIAKLLDKKAGIDVGSPEHITISQDAEKWQGWGTALKPAFEPIILARKPIQKGLTLLENVRLWGTGAINIDATRVPTSEEDFLRLAAGVEKIRAKGGQMAGSWKNSSDLSGANPANPLGRWPANFVHDGSEEVISHFPATGPSSAARFFYCPKANTRDRDEGLEDFPAFEPHDLVDRKEGQAGLSSPRAGAGRSSSGRKNPHPTVKPTPLMEYLIKLVTPPGAVLLDPFAGSGSTLKAARNLSMTAVGIELDSAYAEIARARSA